MHCLEREGHPLYSVGECLSSMYANLDGHFGNLHWWPGESELEVMIGAVLTQSTAWSNVERAIDNLKKNRLLDIRRLLEIDTPTLELLLRPTGFFRVKTMRLQNLLQFIQRNYAGDVDRMFRDELWVLREKLLRVQGIGEETADCILLYGGGKPIFVVDAYTRRILVRHGLIGAKATYGEVQRLFMDHFPHDRDHFGQFHALFVEAGKTFCGAKQKCGPCPLGHCGRFIANQKGE